MFHTLVDTLPPWEQQLLQEVHFIQPKVTVWEALFAVDNVLLHRTTQHLKVKGPSDGL